MSKEQSTRPDQKLPPAEFRFKKGQSGNRKGRPKGSVSLKKLTHKVARRKYRTGPDAPAKPLLQLVIEALIRGAASGSPSLVVIHDQLRSKILAERNEKGGLLVVPATAPSLEAFVAAMETADADRRDPSTYVNYKSEEFCKAARGERTALGEALLAFHRRWGCIPE
jgi:hypothetical protein